LAAHGFAIGLKCIAARADLLAGLRVPTAGSAILPVALSDLPVALSDRLETMCTHVATERSVIVSDFSGAELKVLELS
jgi:hypothetical protein